MVMQTYRFIIYLLILKIFVSSGERVVIPPKGQISINCQNGTKIQVLDIIVGQMTKQCPSQPCVISDETKEVIENECNDKDSCALSTNIGFGCLHDTGYLTLSYSCKESAVDCDFKHGLCQWKNISEHAEENCKWIWSNVHKHIYLTGTEGSAYLEYQSFYTSSASSCMTVKYNAYMQQFCERQLELYVNKRKIYDFTFNFVGSKTIMVDIMEGGDLRIRLTGVCRSCSYSIHIDDIKLLPGKCSGETNYVQSCLMVNKDITIHECKGGHVELNEHSFSFDPSIMAMEACDLDNKLILDCANHGTSVDEENMFAFNLLDIVEHYPECFKINRMSVLYQCKEDYPLSTSSAASSEVTSEPTSTPKDPHEIVTSSSSVVTMEEVQSEPAKTFSDLKTVVGVGVGILLLVCISILAVFLYRRSQTQAAPDMRCDTTEKYIMGNVNATLERSDHVQSYAEINLHRNSMLQKRRLAAETKNGNQSKEKKGMENKAKHAGNEATSLPDASYNHINWKSTKSQVVVLLQIRDFESNLTGSYDVLDRQVTGYNRTKSTNDYELANLIAKSKTDTVMNAENPYNHAICQVDGTYNTTRHFDRGEYEDNVYSQSVDTVYDTTNHRRRNLPTMISMTIFIVKEKVDV